MSTVACSCCGQAAWSGDVDGEGLCVVCQPCPDCGSVDCEPSLLGLPCEGTRERVRAAGSLRGATG